MTESNPLFTYPSYTLSGWQGPVNSAPYTSAPSNMDAIVSGPLEFPEQLVPRDPATLQSHVVRPTVARSMSLSDIYMQPASSTQRRHRRRQRQNEHHVSRPPNCFILFRREFVKQHNQSGVDDRRMLSARAAQAWKELPEHLRTEWKALADAVAADHLARNPGYHYHPRRRQSSASPVSGHTSRARSLDFDACTTISESSSQADDYFDFRSAEETTSSVSSPRSSFMISASTASGSVSTSASEWSTTSVEPAHAPYITGFILPDTHVAQGGFEAPPDIPSQEGIPPRIHYMPQPYHLPQGALLSAVPSMRMSYAPSRHASLVTELDSASTPWTLMPPTNDAHLSRIATGWSSHHQTFTPMYEAHGYPVPVDSSSSVTPTTHAYSNRSWDHPPTTAGYNGLGGHQSPSTEENMGI